MRISALALALLLCACAGIEGRAAEQERLLPQEQLESLGFADLLLYWNALDRAPGNRFATEIRRRTKWTAETLQRAAAGKVEIGDGAEFVRVAWGEPSSTFRHDSRLGTLWQWTWEAGQVRIGRGVSSWRVGPVFGVRSAHFDHRSRVEHVFYH